MHINFKSQNICEIKTSAINMIWRTEEQAIIIIYSHSILIMALTYNNCHQPGAIYACMLSLIRHVN